MIQEHREAAGQGRRRAAEMREAHEAVWEDTLTQLLNRLGRRQRYDRHHGGRTGTGAIRAEARANLARPVSVLFA